MKKSVFFILFSIPFLLFSSGCWNNRELGELGIAVAMGIDKEGEQFVATVQLVNPAEISNLQGSGTRAPVVVYREKGATIFEAIRKLTTTAPRKTFYPHLRVLVIGEELAKEGFSKSLDLLVRDQEMRSDFYILIAKNSKAADILSVMPPVEKIPAQNMFIKLETSQDVWAPTLAVTLGELIEELVVPGKQPVITGIEIIGDYQSGKLMENVQSSDPPARLRFTSFSIFDKDKLQGWLSEDESKGVNYINGNVKSTIVVVPCPGGENGHVSIELLRTSQKRKSNVKANHPEMNLTLKAEGNIGEISCPVDLTKQKTIKDLEKLTEKDIKDVMMQSIHVAQKGYALDIFGFGLDMHRSDPKYWKTVKNNWDEHFSDMRVNIEVEVSIRKFGKRTNSFINELEG
ncbi:Ger(x)C family spore germination protein [Bacillus sp. RO2]|uniref:Ger(x)C family spore germination protein n=1 Tax=Bacillus sp. RO2 TaxID=2723913 RepID=UPI00145F928F|nr:Ger(x)C family spore germination protein [Bacillus sp. RO2]NMH72602.1 Ger(x)C family spore germination protein [Bacillus sp. RO2]